MLCSQALTGLPRPLGAARVLLDQAEDQLALAARVAGVDELVTSLRLACLTTADRRLLVLSTGLRSKCGGITGRWAKLHFAALDVVLLGGLDLDQVAHGTGDHVLVVLEMVFVLVELARNRR